MQINKLKKGSWVGNLVKHAKHDKIRKQHARADFAHTPTRVSRHFNSDVSDRSQNKVSRVP